MSAMFDWLIDSDHAMKNVPRQGSGGRSNSQDLWIGVLAM